MPPMSISDLPSTGNHASKAGLEIRGIIIVNGEPSFYLCSPAFPRGRWMRLGETRSDLMVEHYLPDLDSVLVEYRGYPTVLSLPQVRIRDRMNAARVLRPLADLTDRELAVEALLIRARAAQSKRVEEERANRDRVVAELKRRGIVQKSSSR